KALKFPPTLKRPNRGGESPNQGRTDNSWGPRAIGDHGAPVSLPKLKKAYEKGTRGISWGPLLTSGPQAVPEFTNGQSAPGPNITAKEDPILWRSIKLQHIAHW
ncbi:unnamed protein product, partial [Staurois parvus]